MKCRFEHDGDCCNSGAKQYMCKCKQPCYTIVPLTNADRIRSMSNDELAWELMTWRIETEAKHHGVESDYPNTKNAILDWLEQPAEV